MRRRELGFTIAVLLVACSDVPSGGDSGGTTGEETAGPSTSATASGTAGSSTTANPTESTTGETTMSLEGSGGSTEIIIETSTSGGQEEGSTSTGTPVSDTGTTDSTTGTMVTDSTTGPVTLTEGAEDPPPPPTDTEGLPPCAVGIAVGPDDCGATLICPDYEQEMLCDADTCTCSEDGVMTAECDSMGICAGSEDELLDYMNTCCGFDVPL